MEKYLVEYGFGDTAEEVNEWKSLGHIEAGTPYDAVLSVYHERNDEVLHAIFRVMHGKQYVYYCFG